jgi:beta-glucosidase
MVSLMLSDRDVSEWDVDAKAWTVVKGSFKVLVGSSSRDIRLEGVMTV